jgi:hypothetical protein
MTNDTLLAEHSDARGGGLFLVSAAAATLALLALAALHWTSPEFDPSWRMISEYANGQYGWLLSCFFAFWAVSSWSLALALRRHLKKRMSRIGLYFLVAAGLGEAMAAAFDINHALHGVAALIGIPSLPVAAMLITHGGEVGRGAPLRIAANLTWIAFVTMAASFAAFAYTYAQAGGDMGSGVAPTVLPPGVIAVLGWANRFLAVAYGLWVIAAATSTYAAGDDA